MHIWRLIAQNVENRVFLKTAVKFTKKRGTWEISLQRIEEIKHSKYKEVPLYRITFEVQQ